MKRLELMSQLQIVQAAVDGRRIEIRHKTGEQDWHESEPQIFNFHLYDYRIKPEPREFWIDLDLLKVTYRNEQDKQVIKVREVLD